MLFYKKNAPKVNLDMPDFVKYQASNPPALAFLDGISTRQQLNLIKEHTGTGFFGPKEQYETWCKRAHCVLDRRNKLIHGALFLKTDGSVLSFARFKGVDEDRNKGIDPNPIQSIEDLCQEINDLLIECSSFFMPKEDPSEKHPERQE